MTTWVLLAGPPATGKSALATALERRLKAVTLSKDRIRSVLFPGSMTDYTGEQDDLCMRAMLEAAAYLTARDRVDFILFDGRTFSREQQVGQVIVAAERAGAAWKIIQLSCADEVVEARLRQNDPAHPAGNRDMALYRKVKQDFEPILQPKLELDTTDGIEGKLDQVQNYLMHSAL
jgi:predicted kinase